MTQFWPLRHSKSHWVGLTETDSADVSLACVCVPLLLLCLEVALCPWRWAAVS